MSEQLTGRGEFFAATKRRYKTVTVPEFGQVRIRSLTEGELTALEVSALGDDDKLSDEKLAQQYVRHIIACVVDKDGNQIFSETDLPKLVEVDAAVMRAVYVECDRHVSSLTVEGAAKNSSKGDDDSPESSQRSAA